MSFNRSQYEHAAQTFFKNNPRLFEKYFSPTLLRIVVDAMSLPSVTAAKIAFDRLVANGTLPRTDGRTDQDDRVEARAAAQANLDKTIADVGVRPLTRDELEFFLSLSKRDLADRYWANDGYNEFHVRYDRAVREHMFTVPARPQVSEAQSAEGDGEFELTVLAYHAMPAAELQRKLRTPSFKLQVMKLIKAGLVIVPFAAILTKGLV